MLALCSVTFINLWYWLYSLKYTILPNLEPINPWFVQMVSDHPKLQTVLGMTTALKNCNFVLAYELQFLKLITCSKYFTYIFKYTSYLQNFIPWRSWIFTLTGFCENCTAINGRCESLIHYVWKTENWGSIALLKTYFLSFCILTKKIIHVYFRIFSYFTDLLSLLTTLRRIFIVQVSWNFTLK